MPDVRIPGGIVTVGGPLRKISVKGKIVTFEDHPYCGPIAVDSRNNGRALVRQTAAFLDAATQWYQQGKKIGPDGLCEWWHDPEPILRQIGPRSYQIVGHHPPVKGS